MKSLWQDDARLEILRRIETVSGSSRGLWGRMNPARMLRHLAQSMSMAAGELDVAPKRLPVRYFPLKQLAIYVLPFPKGVPTAPELLEGSDESIDAARADLRSAIAAFHARSDVLQWHDHPAFGSMTRRAWGVLTYRHCDHHLRQFGA